MKPNSHNYPECKKHGIYIGEKCNRCETEKRRKKEGKCIAILCHGPGHQSKTYCQKIGKHAVHMARYGCYDELATWRGMKKFTGYFDDPPSED